MHRRRFMRLATTGITAGAVANSLSPSQVPSSWKRSPCPWAPASSLKVRTLTLCSARVPHGIGRSTISVK
jgi:hypothetical protein